MNQKIKEQQEFKETKNIEIGIPKWQALGHHSLKEYQGWCSFNDVESQSYNPDISSEELEKLCIMFEVNNKKKGKKYKQELQEDLEYFDIEEIIEKYGKL